jgi:hypothetical protein
MRKTSSTAQPRQGRGLGAASVQTTFAKKSEATQNNLSVLSPQYVATIDDGRMFCGRWSDARVVHCMFAE